MGQKHRDFRGYVHKERLVHYFERLPEVTHELELWVAARRELNVPCSRNLCGVPLHPFLLFSLQLMPRPVPVQLKCQATRGSTCP